MATLKKCENGHYYDDELYRRCPHCRQKPSFVECENGHFYDAKKYQSCPVCELERKDGTRPLIKEAFSEIDKVEDDRYLFISYSHKNADQMNEIRGILDNNGYSYWFDSGIRSGVEWTNLIYQKIKRCAQFLLLMSRDAENSENVCDEVYVAQKNNKDFVIVFLEDFELDSGLDMRIGRKQRIIKPMFSKPEEFERRLCYDLTDKAKNGSRSASGVSESEIFSRLRKKYDIIKILSEKRKRKTLLGKNRVTEIPVFIKLYLFDKGDADSKQPFRSEVDALKNCISPYLPQLLDVYECEQYGYIVENFIEGRRLSQLRNLSELDAVNIMIQLAHAVDSLHKSGVVHCDIKMDNIVISRHYDAFLIDLNSSMLLNKFNYGWSTGTVGYAAPEQYERQYRPDVRTDIYSLGKVFENILQSCSCDDDEATLDKGRAFEPSSFPLPPDRRAEPAWGSETVLLPTLEVEPESEPDSALFPQVNTSVLYGTQILPPTLPLSFGTVHPRIRTIIDKMTAERKRDRYQSAAELKKALENCRLILELEEKLPDFK